MAEVGDEETDRCPALVVAAVLQPLLMLPVAGALVNKQVGLIRAEGKCCPFWNGPDDVPLLVLCNLFAADITAKNGLDSSEALSLDETKGDAHERGPFLRRAPAFCACTGVRRSVTGHQCGVR